MTGHFISLKFPFLSPANKFHCPRVLPLKMRGTKKKRITFFSRRNAKKPFKINGECIKIKIL